MHFKVHTVSNVTEIYSAFSPTKNLWLSLTETIKVNQAIDKHLK